MLIELSIEVLYVHPYIVCMGYLHTYLAPTNVQKVCSSTCGIQDTSIRERIQRAV